MGALKSSTPFEYIAWRLNRKTLLLHLVSPSPRVKLDSSSEPRYTCAFHRLVCHEVRSSNCPARFRNWPFSFAQYYPPSHRAVLKLERDAAQDAYQMIREALVPVPTEKGVELMAQWQAIALNIKPKRKPAEYMDLRFANEVMAELGQSKVRKAE
jgi:hypothetical protein